MKCALIEYNYFHDITFSTFIHILTKLGISVDIYTTQKNIERKPLAYTNERNNIKIKSIDSVKTKIYEKLKGYGSYDFLIVNSVEPSRILDRVSKFDVPVLAVMHNPTLLIQNENYRKFFDNP